MGQKIVGRPRFGIDIWVYTNRSEINSETFNGLIDLASKGYYESELMNHFTRGRKDALPLYQTIVLNAVLLVGGLVTAIKDDEGRIIATAWWLPPGKDLPIWYMFKKFPQIFKAFGLKNLLVASYSFLMLIFTEIIAMIKYGLNTKKAPRIYLANIVAYKEYRQKGLAKKLMQPVLEWADENKLLVYLEADGLTNIEKVYPCFGFKIFRWIKLLDRAVKYAAMIRFPKNSS